MQATRFDIGRFTAPFERRRGESMRSIYVHAGQLAREILNARYNETPFAIFDLRALAMKCVQVEEVDKKVLGFTMYDQTECGFHYFRVRDNRRRSLPRAIDAAVDLFQDSGFEAALAADPSHRRTMVRELDIQGFPHLTMDYVYLPLQDISIVDQYVVEQ